MKASVITLRLLIVFPIWWYLLYKILEAINASELTWFLFYIYMPVGVVALILEELVKAELKGTKS